MLRTVIVDIAELASLSAFLGAVLVWARFLTI